MGRRVGNRFCLHPMEGWDSDIDGRPTRQTRRRWQARGRSGAKVLWNESVAVNPLGRSSPEQLLVAAHTVESLTAIRREQVDAHVEAHGRADDLVVGIQLTHSGRYSKPDGRPRPVAVRRHPLFDETVGPGADTPLLTDDELRSLIDDYVRAAELAQLAGFDFVDVKSCHGYLSHELLGAFERPGEFGGSLENRTRFLREIVTGIRAAAPGLGVAVRLERVRHHHPRTRRARRRAPDHRRAVPVLVRHRRHRPPHRSRRACRVARDAARSGGRAGLDHGVESVLGTPLPDSVRAPTGRALHQPGEPAARRGPPPCRHGVVAAGGAAVDLRGRRLQLPAAVPAPCGASAGSVGTRSISSASGACISPSADAVPSMLAGRRPEIDPSYF